MTVSRSSLTALLTRSKAALSALLEEKADIERRAATDLRAAKESRSDLEHRLAAAAVALEAAEKKLKAVEVDQDRSNVRTSDQESKEAVMATSATTPTAKDGAGTGEAVGSGRFQARPATRIGEQDSAASPVSGVQEPEYFAKVRLDHGKSESKVRNAEAQAAESIDESARSELDRVRASEAAAAAAEAVRVASEARRVAEERVLELEGEAEKTVREHERRRALAEARLQEVERRLGEEERESGLEVRKGVPSCACARGTSDDAPLFLCRGRSRLRQALMSALHAQPRVLILFTWKGHVRSSFREVGTRYGLTRRSARTGGGGGLAPREKRGGDARSRGRATTR